MARAPLSSAVVDAMRQRLTQLALDLHRREGLEAVSLRRLAEAAGISHTLPYRYFRNKEALLVAMRVACTRHFERFVREREEVTAPVLDRIHSVAAGLVGFAQAHPAEYQLMFSTYQPPPDKYPELLAARRSFFDHAMGVVQEAIDQKKLKGEARALTHLFWISLHGLMALHLASQLVHGCRLEDLVPPLMAQLIDPGRPQPASQRRRAAPSRARGRARA